MKKLIACMLPLFACMILVGCGDDGAADTDTDTGAADTTEPAGDTEGTDGDEG